MAPQLIGPFRRWNLNAKVSLFGVCGLLVVAVSMVLLAAWQSGQYNRLAQREVDGLIDADLNHIAQGIYNLVDTENKSAQQEVNHNLVVARRVLENAGPVTLSSQTVTWKAVDQFTNKVNEIRLPKMLVGGQWLGQNDDFRSFTPIVDEVTGLVGETATIFQRMNEDGDMLRVATTVRDAGNSRAIGTYIPARHSDGTLNPVILAIKQGKNYHGRAFVVNDWYLTAYEPIVDPEGRLIGMFYVGVKQAAVEARIRHAILKTTVGKTGYVYILGGKNESRGRYIVSQRGERDGENIWDSKDSDGNLVIQSIVKKALVLNPSEMTTERYRWQNPGEIEPRWKIARLAYFEPWDWIIGVSVYEDELQNYSRILTDGRVRMTVIMSISALIIVLLFGFFGTLIAHTIIAPVRQLNTAVNTIIEGNLTDVVDIRSSDEIGTLAKSFNTMTQKLRTTLDGLRDSEETFRALSERNVDTIMRFDREYRHLYVNPSIEIQTGIQAALFIGKRHEDLGFPKDLCLLWENILEKVFTTKEVNRVEFQLPTGVWIDWLCVPEFDANGEVKAVITSARDITKRKQTEEERAKLEAQLMQAMKMEAIGRLAGGVAHDFNNLLTGISGNIQLALMDVRPDDPLTDTLMEINRAADRAAALTRQLLVFSRKQIIEPQVLNLNDLIINLQKMLTRLIGEDIELQTALQADLGRVQVDPGQLEQILVNLAVNARDAMPDGGKLIIETSEIALDEEYCGHHAQSRPGRFVILVVSDTGQGMTSEVKKHIFEPFFTTKPVGLGTGLGLATIYGAVMQANGFIQVYSEVGVGTTFKIFLPLVEKEIQWPAAKEESPEMVGGKETILHVEDDAFVQTLTIKILNRLGYNVLTATNGEEALAIVTQNPEPIDLLLTDVVMPGMNGQQLAERLTGLIPNIKVIFMSGYTADTIAHHGVLETGLNFISKPFTPQALAKKLRDVLKK